MKQRRPVRHTAQAAAAAAVGVGSGRTLVGGRSSVQIVERVVYQGGAKG